MRHRRTAGLFVCSIFYSDRLTKCEKRLALPGAFLFNGSYHWF